MTERIALQRRASPRLVAVAAVAVGGLFGGLLAGRPELVAVAAPFAVIFVAGVVLAERPVVSVDDPARERSRRCGRRHRGGDHRDVDGAGEPGRALAASPRVRVRRRAARTGSCRGPCESRGARCRRRGCTHLGGASSRSAPPGSMCPARSGSCGGWAEDNRPRSCGCSPTTARCRPCCRISSLVRRAARTSPAAAAMASSSPRSASTAKATDCGR